jgi:hypothetical protein
VFNSKVAIAPKNQIGPDNEEGQPKVITPTEKVFKPSQQDKSKKQNKRNDIGNPGLSLIKNHPANIIESRRKYAAREYLDKVKEAGYQISPLAASALGLAQDDNSGVWNTNGSVDERLYGQNLTKYNDTKLVPKTTDGLTSMGKNRERTQRLRNKGFSDRDSVNFGIIIRQPNFMVDMSPDVDGSQRVAVGRDPSSGDLADPLRELSKHSWDAKVDFENTINGIEKNAFPEDEGVHPKITNLTGAINRGLRGYSKRFNTSLFSEQNGNIFKGFTTLSKNIQNMFSPYDRTDIKPPTSDEFYKAKNEIRNQKPELFDDKNNYINSEIGAQVNDKISRFFINKNNKAQLEQHNNEYNGLIRALKNVAVCPCPHCQINNYENPLSTALDASLHREVKSSNDPILKNIFKKHFGFYNPHALLVQDPETIYTREDGTKGGGHPHPLATNMVRQVLHNRLKLREQGHKS